MADNLVLNAGSGGKTVRSLQDASSIDWPVGVTAYATTLGDPDVLMIPVAAALSDSLANPTTLLHGSCVLLWDGAQWVRCRGDSSNGLDVDVTRVQGTVNVADGGGSLTVDGTVAATQSGAWSVSVSGAVDTELTTDDLDTGAGTDTRAVVGLVLAESGGGVLVGSANPMPISDAGGSITVDGTVTIQDGGGSITVDGTVSTELTTDDLDTGAGTDTRAVVGLVLAENGGGVLVGSANPMPIWDAGGTISIDDAGSSITVDGTVSISGTVGCTQSGSWSVAIDSPLPAGTNNIGDVDVLTQPARQRTTDHVGAADMTDAIMSGTTALTPKFATIAVSASGDNTVVAAVPGKKVRVLKYAMVAAAAVTAKWKDGASTDASGPMALAANGGLSDGYCPVGLFETSPGNALVLNLSAAVSVAGHITYVEI